MPAKSVKTEKYHILKDRQLLLTCFLFLILVVGLNVIFRIPNSISLFVTKHLVLATANASAWLINLVGIKAQINQNTIVLRSRSLLVNLECTAIYLMILYGSFVLVYPAAWMKKAVGLVLGLLAIFVANILRLLLTAYVVEFKPQYFQYFHDYVWQIAFIIFVIFLWVVWIEKVVGYESKTALSG